MTDRASALRNRLKKNLARLHAWRTRESVTCFRAYDRDIPEVPLCIDVYEGEDGARRLHIVAFAPRHGGGATFDRAVDELAGVAGDVLDAAPANRFVQLRERERGGAVEADDAAASVSSFFVREGQARFLVRMGARRDPGLFLDHRTTRRLVADDAVGRSVLNLFAYTGSFSVHAALRGAQSTTAVDLSSSTVRWATENLAANGLDPRAHRVVADDVFAFLDNDGERYDVIVLDPPSVSRSRRATRDLDIQRDHPALVDRCIARLKPRGTLWFSTNLQTFVPAPLPAALAFDEVTSSTVPLDFRQRPHRCFRVRVRL
jgi:23S rRNA G2069 N7-methylase RlmK/C1962 C5-methylase RlmI